MTKIHLNLLLIFKRYRLILIFISKTVKEKYLIYFLKDSETSVNGGKLKNFSELALEVNKEKTEVKNIKKYVQTSEKLNPKPSEDLQQKLDELINALEEKEKLLQSAVYENFYLESDRDNLDEKIIQLRAELEEKDATIMKLRHKIKKFDKFREDMLAEQKKTRTELAVRMDKVNGEFDFMRHEFQSLHSAINELLTGSRKDNNKKKRNGWNNSPSTQKKNARLKKTP